MTSAGTQVFSVICALLAILGLIFLFFFIFGWLRKKMGGGGFGSGRNIRIRECVSVAQDKQLIIVTVGGKTMLIGVTGGSMRKLCDLDEDDLAQEPEQSSEESGFMRNLRTAIARRGQGASAEELERWQEGQEGQVTEEEKSTGEDWRNED